MRSERVLSVFLWLSCLLVTPARAEEAFDHGPWDAALKASVKDGRVD